MQFTAFPLILLGSLLPMPAFSQDWLGTEFEEPIQFGFLSSLTGRDNPSHSFDLSLPLGEAFTLGLFLSEDRFNQSLPRQEVLQVNSTQQSLILETILNEDFDLIIERHFEGEQQQLEINFSVIGIRQYLASWQWSFSYQLGDFLIFPNTNLGLENPLQSPVKTSIEGYSIGLSRESGPIYWQLVYQEKRYDRNLTQLQTRPILPFLLQPGALVQDFLLLEDQLQFTAGYLLDDFDISIAISETTSAVDQKTRQGRLLGVYYVITDSLQIVFNLGQPEGLEQQVAAGLRWSL
jgi:hypothetical protein